MSCNWSYPGRLGLGRAAAAAGVTVTGESVLTLVAAFGGGVAAVCRALGALAVVVVHAGHVWGLDVVVQTPMAHVQYSIGVWTTAPPSGTSGS